MCSKYTQTTSKILQHTLPKTNIIAPENGASQKETHLAIINFQVLCHVSFRECNPLAALQTTFLPAPKFPMILLYSPVDR